jgi:hypothetical protein
MRHLLIVGLLLVACEKSATGPTPVASASASAEVASEPPRAPRVAPLDVEVAKLQKALRCGATERDDACGVLARFAKAGRFILDVPSGEGRWFGRAYVVEQGKERFQYVTMLARRLPTARVGPGELPLSVGIDPLPGQFVVFGQDLWSGLESSKGRRAKKKNPAFGYLKAYAPKAERGAMNTQGASVQTLGEIGEDTGYFRQESLKRIYLVRPATAGAAAPGDGTYAALWMAVW